LKENVILGKLIPSQDAARKESVPELPEPEEDENEETLGLLSA
jgi:hypothetical protein